MEKFQSKGTMLFVLNENNELCTATRKIDDELKEYPEEIRNDIKERFFSPSIYSLIKGKEFVADVESGCIIDDDGSLANIFVDGFDSNLGLYEGGFSQGKFLVTKEMFLSICDEHEVLVNWANK